MANDLHAPLGLKATKRSFISRIPFGLIGAALIALTITGVVTWVSFLPDPYGGQPVATVRVDRSKTGIGIKDIGVAAPGQQGGQTPAGEGAGRPDAGGPGSTRVPVIQPAPDATKRPGMPAEGQPLPSIAVGRVSDPAGKYGPLPKIASDGSRPLEVYARPAPRRPGTTPRIVIVVGGLGLSQTGTQEAIRLLPPDVTFAFSPYGTSLDRWTSRARQDGHELLLQVPMEPFDYPDNDPGPQTLASSVSPEENLDRLRWLMSRMSTYVGIVNYMGGKFTSADESLQPVMREIAGRGLMYLDDGSSTRSLAGDAARPSKTPFAQADVVIDAVTTDDFINARLEQLESLARQKGLAIGTASALPISIRRISEWAKTLEARGVIIVPVSSAVRDGQG